MKFLPTPSKVYSYLILGATAFTLAKPSFVAAGPNSSQFTPANLDGVTGSGTGGQVSFATEFGFSNLSQAVNTIISVVFFGAALAAFIFIVIGAFQYVTAGDDAAKTEKSRKTITNAVVGLILVALVYVIFQIVIRIVPGLSQWFSSSSGGSGTLPQAPQAY